MRTIRLAPRIVLYSPHALAFALALAALAVFAFYFYVLNHGEPAWSSDTYEYAAAARNLVQGRGLSNTIPNVLDVWVLRQFPPPQPYAHHDSGLVLLLAGGMWVLGPEKNAIGWLGGIFFVLLVPLTFYLGKWLYNSYVGLFAALLALFNIQLIAYSTSGLSEVPYAFCMTLFLFVLYRQKTRAEIFLAGILFGWLMVLRSNTISAFPAIILFMLFSTPPGDQTRASLRSQIAFAWNTRAANVRRVIIFLIGVLLLLAPNMLRNMQTIGSPFYTIVSMYSLVFYTDVFDAKTSDYLATTGIDVNPIEYIVTHPDQLWGKMQYQLREQLENLWRGGLNEPTYVDALEIVLLLISALLPSRGESLRQRNFRWMIYLCIASALLVGALTHLRWRHLYGYLPIALILIANVVLKLTTIQPARLVILRNPFLVMGIFLALIAVPTARAVSQTIGTGQFLDYQYSELGEWIRENTPKRADILFERGKTSAGVQYALGWYSRRTMIEIAPFTSDYTRRYDLQPYILFVNAKPQSYENTLVLNGFANYVEIAKRPNAYDLDAALYAPP